VSLLYWGLYIWTQYFRWGLTSVEQKSRITSLDLLTATLLMQSRIQLAFWAAKAYYWLMSSLPSVSTPKSQQGCVQSFIPSACIDIGGCHNSGAKSCTRLFWTSWGTAGPTAWACLGLSGWHPVPQTNWPYHTASCHLQTWWEWIQFHYWCHWWRY